MRKALLLIACLFSLAGSYSQTGSLDRSFGDNGMAKTDFPTSYNLYSNIAHKVLQKGDGTYYLLIETNGQAVIAHRLADGTADASYYNKGYSAPAYFIPQDAALQSDGKIVVVGQVDVSTIYADHTLAFALARYNTDGTLDNSFGTNGVVTTPINVSAYAYAVAIQPDGKIIAVGYSYTDSGAVCTLARYNSNGTLDASFGTGGIVATPSITSAYSLVIQSDGKIVVAGYNYANTDTGGTNFALARYNSDGSLDASFGSNGLVTTPDTGPAYAIAIQSDGKFVVSGNSSDNFIVVRYNTNGAIDNTFGSNGKVQTPLGISQVNNTVTVQKDGKIIVAGGIYTNSDYIFLIRYNRNGSLDNTFGTNGIVTTSVGGYAYSISVLSDGKIVATGNSFDSGSSSFALVRYTSNGSPDNTFGTNGIVLDYIKVGNFGFNTVAVQGDGKVVVAGYNYGNTDMISPDFALARYNSDGSLDASFGTNGLVITPNIGSAYAVAIQRDGKIIAVGTNSFTLVRYNTDGSLDNTFGTNGVVTTLFYYTDEEGNTDATSAAAHAISIQNDGKIVVAGEAEEDWHDDIALARYNPDGTLDNNFGANGIVKTPIDFYVSIQSISFQQDGKIVVAGSNSGGVWNDRVNEFLLARYNRNGSIDGSFGNEGITTVGFEYDDAGANTVTIQNDGKILVAGSANLIYHVINDDGDDEDEYSPLYSFALARLNPDGSLDNSFGTAGTVTTPFYYTDKYGNAASDASIYAIAVQPDGKIVATGQALSKNGNTLTNVFALTRYNVDGSLDATFGTGGKITTPVNLNINNTLITADRIYAVGAITYYGNVSAVAAFHFNTINSNSLVSSYTLINADIDKGIKELKEGSVIALASLTTIRLNIRANTAPTTVDSVAFTLTGEQQRWHTEKGTPYSLFNDNSGNYKGWIPAPGAYTLTATPYLNGTAGTPLTIHFSVTPFLINSFTLVNADNDQDLTALSDNAVIDLSSLPTQHLNIRANTNPYHVGSVLLTLDGTTRVENGIPYAVGGDASGDYFAMTLTPGQHTLAATPYSEHTAFGATTGEGVKGEALTIHFTVTQSSLTKNQSKKELFLKDNISSGSISASPNPFTNGTIVSFTVPKTTYTTISVYTTRGEQIAQVFAAVAEAGKIYRVAINNKGWSSGLYVVQLTTSTYSQSYKLLLNR